jgi:glycosyltransferase involved in cell wall biosynthesis
LCDLSIVIPAFNRECEISRAIRSCLVQESAVFEVIVVDDGSTDNCYDVAAGFRDPRLSVLRHSSNRGRNTARNTGALAAKGEWLIFLDSDDELAPDALKTIGGIVAKTPGNVHRVGFKYRRDDGLLAPLPATPEQVIDYAGYLAWLEGRRLYDFLACTRKHTFDQVRYREARWSDDALYHLDFAERYRTWLREETLAVVHLDARNRLGSLRRSPKQARSSAAELGEEMDILLHRHGDAMRRFAPQTLEKFRRLRAAYYFLAGNRAAGVKHGLACLRTTPLMLEVWALLILGVTNIGALARVRSWRRPGQDLIRQRRHAPAASLGHHPES